MLLESLGLALDLGGLDGFIPDPVDAAKAGVALLKGLVKQIPEGPAREAIMVVMLGLTKNLDEAGRFFGAFYEIAKNGDVLTAPGKNPRALAAMFKAGPEAMEILAKNEDAALALLILDGRNKWRPGFRIGITKFRNSAVKYVMDS